MTEQALPPWHEEFPQITRQLLERSTLYGPLLYAAQGGIDGPKAVNIIAGMHNTGGALELKSERLVKPAGVGLDLHPVFPDPKGLESLLGLAYSLPEEIQQKIGITDKIACETWNRGIGMLFVVPNEDEAVALIKLATPNYEAAIAGTVIKQKEIHFRGHMWSYE